MATLFVLHEVIGQEKVKPIDPFPVLILSFGLQTSHKCPPVPICDADHTLSSTCIHQLLTCLGSAVESLGWHWEGYSLPFGTNELRNEPSHLVMPLFFFLHSRPAFQLRQIESLGWKFINWWVWYSFCLRNWLFKGVLKPVQAFCRMELLIGLFERWFENFSVVTM